MRKLSWTNKRVIEFNGKNLTTINLSDTAIEFPMLVKSVNFVILRRYGF